MHTTTQHPTTKPQTFLQTLALLALLFTGLTLTSCQQTHATDDHNHSSIIETQAANDTLSIENQDGTLTPVTLNEDTRHLNIRVAEAAICENVEHRAPVGAGDHFMSETGRLYCFSKLELPAGETQEIVHVWKRNGEIVNKVNLTVKGPSWRTKSYKTINENLKGNWSVDITSLEGDLLKTMAFSVE
ncbi:MAG: DUF2914 domain-containing protein [Bacteroidota bacterium]